MKIKKVLLLTIISLSTTVLKAQNLVVTLNNFTSETFLVSSIQSIKFGDSTMILKELNGTVTTWDITDINYYDFSSDLGLNDQIKVENSTLELFPNPSNNLVNIQFFAVQSGNIMIDIIDGNGKQIQQIYRGAHQGQQTYQWHSHSVKGTYFCRITTEKKVITKPVVIQ